MLVLFYGEGRLGNQVFQYQALNWLAPAGSRIVAVGLEDLDRAFRVKGLPLHVLTRSGLAKRIVKYVIVPLILRPLARHLRLCNYVRESRFDHPSHPGAGGKPQARGGLLSSITFVDGGYYQNGGLWPKIFPAAVLQLKESLRNEANEFLRSVVPEGRCAAFVHVRRGDYLGFSSYGVDDLSLPAGYFREGITRVLDQVPDAFFVFVTDEKEWVEHAFADIQDKAVASFDPLLDFSIMTQCQAGIVSNSTYSLAAALLVSHPRIMVAPEHWFGFRIGKWLPPTIRFDDPKLLYVPVPL